MIKQKNHINHILKFYFLKQGCNLKSNTYYLPNIYKIIMHLIRSTSHQFIVNHRSVNVCFAIHFFFTKKIQKFNYNHYYISYNYVQKGKDHQKA